MDKVQIFRYASSQKGFKNYYEFENAHEFITACQDGLIRLFDFSNATTQALKTFEGHTAKIYNVIYSLVLRNIFASAGDDRTIRIW